MRKFIIICFAIAILIGCSQKDTTEKGLAETDQTSPDSLVIELTGENGKSVFDLLLENHQVDYQESPMGIFIKAIDSMANNSQSFWIYSVNDTMANTSSNKYITNDGDLIKWHYRKNSK